MTFRVLAFEAQPTLFAGGQERSLFEVCSALAGRGHEVGLVYQREGELLAHYNQFCNVTAKIPSRVFRVRQSLEFVLDLLRASRLRRKWDWDLLYANQYFDLPFVAALGFFTRTPIVCHLRLSAPHYLSRQYRAGLRRCARLIATSKFTAESYIGCGLPSEQFAVIHNGVDVQHFDSVVSARGPDEPDRRVLYMGRVVPEKGIGTLIEAVAQLSSAGHTARCRLTILGDGHGDYPDKLRQAASALHGVDVRFRAHLSDIRGALAESDLVVVPSECDESFGRVVIEAMAAGVPVVATRDGGIPEVLADRFDAHLVPPGDATALAAKLAEFLHWRDTEPDLGERGRKWVARHFSATKAITDIEAVMTDVVDQRQRAARKESCAR